MNTPPSPPDPLTLRDAYDAVGVNYRYFLGWRHQLFAGYLAVLAALTVGYSWVSAHQSNLTVILLLAGFLSTLVFWVLEYRNRDLFHACQQAGESCEAGLPAGAGLFTLLQNEYRGGRITQSRALDALFLSVGLFTLIGLIRWLLFSVGR